VSEDFLPLTLNVEEGTIHRVAGGWEIRLHREDAADIGCWKELPDPILDQLLDAEDIVFSEGEDRYVQGPRHRGDDS